jgi:hypothetical protein
VSVKRYWRAHFLALELMVCVVAAAAFAFWVFRTESGYSTVNAVLNQNRAAVYGALSALFGSLLGFVIAGVAIALPFVSDPKLALLRDSKQHVTLWKLFFAATRALAFATLVCLLALILERDNSPHMFLVTAVVFVSLWAAARLFRVVEVLEGMVWLMVNPKHGE